MRRQPHDVYATAKTVHYIVRQDMERRLIDYRRLGAGANLCAAVAATRVRLEREAWTFESDMRWGFSFLNRDGERALMFLTERDPNDDSSQSFNPHLGGC